MEVDCDKCYTSVDFEKIIACGYTYNLQLGRFLSVYPMALVGGQDYSAGLSINPSISQ